MFDSFLNYLANVKRDSLLEHQQTLDFIIQNYSLIPTVITTLNSRCLSIFLCIAQMLKSSTVDFLDTTALMTACRWSNATSSIETVQLLLDYGVNINHQDKFGNTALMTSLVYYHEKSVEIVKLLLEYYQILPCNKLTKVFSV